LYFGGEGQLVIWESISESKKVRLVLKCILQRRFIDREPEIPMLAFVPNSTVMERGTFRFPCVVQQEPEYYLITGDYDEGDYAMIRFNRGKGDKRTALKVCFLFV
jgi:hypothetical protein